MTNSHLKGERITIYIMPDLLEKVKAVGDAKKWSVSKSISVLLEGAIKEKERKKRPQV